MDESRRNIGEYRLSKYIKVNVLTNMGIGGRASKK